MSRFANIKALGTRVGPPVQVLPSRAFATPRNHLPANVVIPAPETNPRDSGANAWSAAENNGLRRAGFAVLLVYLFVRFGYVTEIIGRVLGTEKTFLIIALGGVSGMLTLLSGGIWRSFRARPIYLYAALMAWMLIVVPFGFWRGGSVAVLKQAFLTEFSALFILAGLVFTLNDVRKVLTVLALACGFVITMSFVYGSEEYGRFAFQFGTLGNANDYAAHLVLLLPMLVFVAFNSKMTAFRIAAAIFSLLGVFLILRTGSRAGVLALGALLLMMILRANAAQRIAAFIAAILLIGAGWVMLPRSTLMRYLMIVDSSVNEQAASNTDLARAVGSSEGRRELLMESLQITATHPLFGVGPGNFRPSAASQSEDDGKRAMWLLTHNTYTEISSETGIPGILLFLATLFSSYRMVRKVYVAASGNPKFDQIRNMAFCLMLSSVGFGICILFASMSYRFYLPAMVGLMVGFAVSARHEMNQMQGQAA